MSPVNRHCLNPGPRKREVDMSNYIKWRIGDEGDELNRGYHLESMITVPRKAGGLTCAVCT